MSEMQDNDCRRKKTTFSAHLAGPPRQSPPKRKTQCPGQSSGRSLWITSPNQTFISFRGDASHTQT